MNLPNYTRVIGAVLLLNLALVAQEPAAAPDAHPSSQSMPGAVAQPTPASGDELSQIRDDLNKMESLNMNMSSEIEFLHDQNLQILLRTNSQMWTLLIRDLRRQIAAEEQRRTMAPPASRK